MTGEAELAPSAGWGVLHLFGKLDASSDHQAVEVAVKSAQAGQHQVVTAALLGHKADLGFMAMGPDLWRLRRLQSDLTAAGLHLTGSFVSLTEVNEYAKGLPAERREPRLHPVLPPEGMTAFCFYPMSKRRGETDNWYRLDYEARERLMMGHGHVGRSFAGRVLQLITASSGLDDWEWGVTLFARHPDDLKDVVYSMRFDEASARYAEFGPFYSGMVGDLGQVLAAVAAP